MKACASIDAYVAGLPPARARVIDRIRRIAKRIGPGVSEGISYGIPAFRRERVFLYCAAFKNHMSLFPPLRTDVALQKRLVRYANGKGNLRFPFDESMPWPLITRVVAALARQDARRIAAGRNVAKRKVARRVVKHTAPRA